MIQEEYQVVISASGRREGMVKQTLIVTLTLESEELRTSLSFPQASVWTLGGAPHSLDLHSSHIKWKLF